VRDAIRRGAAENEVQKHEEKLTGVWRQMSTLRRRYDKWCKGDDIEDCAHKQRYEESCQSMVKVLQQNTWIDDRKFLISCVRARAEQGNIKHPAYGTWTADFMLRQNESRAFLGKYLNDSRDFLAGKHSRPVYVTKYSWHVCVIFEILRQNPKISKILKSVLFQFIRKYKKKVSQFYVL